MARPGSFSIAGTASEIPFPAGTRERRQAVRGRSGRWIVPDGEVAQDCPHYLAVSALPNVREDACINRFRPRRIGSRITLPFWFPMRIAKLTSLCQEQGTILLGSAGCPSRPDTTWSRRWVTRSNITLLSVPGVSLLIARAFFAREFCGRQPSQVSHHPRTLDHLNQRAAKPVAPEGIPLVLLGTGVSEPSCATANPPIVPVPKFRV